MCVTQNQAQIHGWSRSYELYPAQESTMRHAIFRDTVYLKSFCICYDNDECSFLSKIDSGGNLIETLEFHKPGKGIQIGGLSNIILFDNKYLFTGDDNWENDSTARQNQHIYSVNKDLKTFDRNLLPLVDGKYQYGVDLVNFGDSIVIVQGIKIISTPNPFKSRMNIICMDSNNVIKWQYQYNDPQGWFRQETGGLIKNSDTSFIVSMRVGWWRIQYFCMNLKGELLWEYTEDNGPVDDLIDPSTFEPYIADVNGKDLIRVWYFDSPNYQHLSPEISRLDYQGNKKWTVPLRDDYGGPGFFPWTKSTVIVGNKIQQLVKAKNGDILGVGYCLLSENYWTTGVPYYNLGYAFRIDTSGKILWERFYLDLDKDKYGDQYLFNVAEADDGAIYLSGTLRDSLPKGTPGTGNDNIWLIKVGPDGCITPGCNDTLVQVSTTKILNKHPYLLTVFPNPGSDQVTIGWNDVPSPPKTLEIRTMAGQLIRSDHIDGNGGNATIDVSYLQGGMYLLNLRGRDWQSMPVKWVKKGE